MQKKYHLNRHIFMALNVFTLLYNHHHHTSLDLFSLPKLKFCTQFNTDSFLHLPPLNYPDLIPSLFMRCSRCLKEVGLYIIMAGFDHLA